MSLDRVKRETNHSYRGPPRKVELFNARKLVHADDVNLVSVCVPQYVQVLHELIVIFGNQHPPTPILPRKVGDHKIRIPSFEFSGQTTRSRNSESYSTGALPGKAKGSEAVRCARSQHWTIMATDLPLIITQAKTSSRPISVLQAESCLYSINTEETNIQMTSWFVLA